MDFFGLAFIYGLCVMFYLMMAWIFFRKNKETLSRMVTTLMLIVGVECIKDLFFLSPDLGTKPYVWMVMTSVDMIVVPLYVFILFCLLKPGGGKLSYSIYLIHELPFVLFPVLFIATGIEAFFYIDVVWAACYGVGYAIWAMIEIPKYHRLLKQSFSYTENINLNWLRYILLSFFVILTLWILDCVVMHFDIEAVYMLGSLVIWMFICYFLYRHESVIDELCEPTLPVESAASPDGNTAKLKERIIDLFENQRIYLHPQLRLSDVASRVNSNRTYVSRFFNDYHGKTFFEYVNEYRVRYAETLLKTSGKKIEEIAELSGFSSRQSFHRIFYKIAGCNPNEYRSRQND